MNNRTNELGQPIGFDVPGWTARPRPPRDVVDGWYVRLEPVSVEAHAADLFEAFSADREGRNWTYLPYGPFASVDETAAWMRQTCLGDDPLFHAIIDKTSGKAVGVASYLRIEPATGVIEVGHINYAPALQRTRGATEAMYLMMARVFDELGYRRYEWKCDALNAPSRAAAERLGFTYEGLFRQATLYKGRNRDTAWYSIIDTEWPTLKAGFEAWLDPANFDEAGQQKRSLASLTGRADRVWCRSSPDLAAWGPMETFLNLTIPVFVVIALGWIAARRGIVPEAAAGGLNAYVFNFGVPCLVVGTLGRQPFGELIDWSFLGAWLVAGLTVFALSALLTRVLFAERAGELAVMGQGAAIGNIGFLGLPLLLEAFGPAGAAPLAAALVVDLILIIPLSILILEAQSGGAGSGASKAVAAIKGALINPFLLSILAGPCGFTQRHCFAGAAGPHHYVPGRSRCTHRIVCAGHVAGGAAGGRQYGAGGADERVEAGGTPGTSVRAMWALNVGPKIAGMGLVLAAMPVASNVFVIAERYGVAVRRCSSAIVISTAIAVITVTAAIEVAKRMG
jgi:predicted permease/RimJ/RimL family protein N-acetyltransferase